MGKGVLFGAWLLIRAATAEAPQIGALPNGRILAPTNKQHFLFRRPRRLTSVTGH